MKQLNISFMTHPVVQRSNSTSNIECHCYQKFQDKSNTRQIVITVPNHISNIIYKIILINIFTILQSFNIIKS